MKDTKIKMEVIGGAEGPCLCIMDDDGGYRLAGPKAWGGGTVLYSFEVCPKELMKELLIYAPEVKQ